MSSESTPTRRLIQHYRTQLLRWNPQINLVSRRNTQQRVDDLLAQAEAGASHALAYLPKATQEPEWKDGLLNYFDLGSGGGIPGVVWHLRLHEQGYDPASCLVEPREKRAWFLQRLTQIPGMPDFNPLCERWGEDTGGEESPCPGLARNRLVPVTERARPLFTLISLKALRLTDLQILAGLARMAPHSIDRSGRVLIARYFPPGQELDPELRSQLKIPATGKTLQRDTLAVQADGAWSEDLEGLPAVGASLVFSRYRTP